MKLSKFLGIKDSSIAVLTAIEHFILTNNELAKSIDIVKNMNYINGKRPQDTIRSCIDKFSLNSNFESKQDKEFFEKVDNNRYRLIPSLYETLIKEDIDELKNNKLNNDQNQLIMSQKRSKSIPIKVTIDDHIFYEPKSIDTYIKTLEYIYELKGINMFKSLDKYFKKDKDKFYERDDATEFKDGYFFKKSLSNDNKFRYFLKDIFKILNIDGKVENSDDIYNSSYEEAIIDNDDLSDSDIIKKENLASKITEKSIIEALEDSIINNYDFNKSTKFYILYKNQVFPPKEIVRLAATKIGIKNIEEYHHYGGSRTNDYLTKLGFKIIEHSEWNPNIQNPLKQAICILGESGNGKTYTTKKALKNENHNILYQILDDSQDHLLYEYIPHEQKYELTLISEFILEANSNSEELYTIIFDECHKYLDKVNDTLLQCLSLKRNDGERFLPYNKKVNVFFSELEDTELGKKIPDNLGFIFISSKPNNINSNEDFKNRLEFYKIDKDHSNINFTIDYLKSIEYEFD